MKRRALIVTDIEKDYSGITPIIIRLAKRADIVIISRNGTNARPPIALKRIANYTVTIGIDPELPNYSAFDGGTLRPIETLESILKREKIDEVVVCGYLLDSMVSQTAFDARALGYDTSVCMNSATVAGENILNTILKLERAGISYRSDQEIWI